MQSSSMIIKEMIHSTFDKMHSQLLENENPIYFHAQ
jgi:hypothetical protein